MLSTKIRTTILALAASGAVAAAGSIAPVASAYKIKVTVGHQVGETFSCAGAKASFENFGTMAENDLKNGDVGSAVQDVSTGNAVLEAAKEKGCDWAALTAPLQSPTAVEPVSSYPVYAVL